jgi:hypothetical protein
VGLLISDQLAVAVMNVFVVIDSDVYGIINVVNGVGAGHSDVAVNLGSYPVSVGSHLLTFYAVNSLGFVSAGHSIPVTIIPDPTSTPGQPALAASSPVASQSVAPYQSPYPTAYPIVTKILFDHHFDVKWRDLGGVRTTYAGYATILNVSSDDCQGC